MAKPIKFSEFKEKVKDHTPVEADRENVAVVAHSRPAYYDLLVRGGFAELQRLIDYYQEEHETRYTESEMANEGSAAKFTLPGDCEAEVTAVKMIYREAAADPADPAIVTRATATWARWEDRHDLICADVSCLAKPMIAMSPRMDFAYIIPRLLAPSIEMLVIWNGIKMDWTDDEKIRAGNKEALVVSQYVLDNLYSKIDNVGIADRELVRFNKSLRRLYVMRRNQQQSIQRQGR